MIPHLAQQIKTTCVELVHRIIFSALDTLDIWNFRCPCIILCFSKFCNRFWGRLVFNAAIFLSQELRGTFSLGKALNVWWTTGDLKEFSLLQCVEFLCLPFWRSFIRQSLFLKVHNLGIIYTCTHGVPQFFNSTPMEQLVRKSFVARII